MTIAQDPTPSGEALCKRIEELDPGTMVPNCVIVFDVARTKTPVPYHCISSCIVNAVNAEALRGCGVVCPDFTSAYSQGASSEHVCKKMAAFEREANPAMVTACASMLEAVRAKDKDAFECMGRCVMAATTKDDAKRCDDVCPAFKRALGM